jgi:Tfp pilus assembly PilM family ATPase
MSIFSPQLVLLELQDDALKGQPHSARGPGPVTIDTPLPSETCRQGMPLELEALGDLIGDLLMRDNLINAYVLASLPPEASQWRVVEWPSADPVPENPLAAMRNLDPPLNLPYALADACLDVQPLPGHPKQLLLAATPRKLVEAWEEVFDNAGAKLDRLSPAQTCLLAGLAPELTGVAASELVAVVAPGEESSSLLLLRGNVPVFEKTISSEPEQMVAEFDRCIAFYRRHDPACRGLKVFLSRPWDHAELLVSPGSPTPVEPFCGDYGSLVLQGLASPLVAA